MVDIDKLSAQGYQNITTVPGKGLCALRRFLFTVGLCYGLNDVGFQGRYCCQSLYEAADALSKWDGVGHPEGDWIKHKGRNVDESNPNIKTTDH